ncbi:MAG: S8 family serine peptidase [Bacteroidales bacterium]
MKKLIYIKFLLIITLNYVVIVNISAQQYYYYGKEKKDVFVDSSTIVMIFNESSTFKNDASSFMPSDNIIDMDISDGTEDIYFARLTFSKKQDDILSALSEYDIYASDLESYFYGYLTQYNEPVWATNEVIIKPFNKTIDESIENVLIKYNASFYEKDKYGVYFYKVINAKNAFDLSAELFEKGFVEYAEPVFTTEYKLDGDPYYDEQYYLNNTGQMIDDEPGTIDMDIDAPEAWEITKGSNEIRVAVIDDGVDLNPVHEDMEGNVLDGYTPGCLINCDGRPRSRNKHGQAVAGIIAANHNSIGIKGIAPNIKIIPFRIYRNNTLDGAYRQKKSKNIGKAINKAWDDFNCDILSNSWGTIESNYVTAAINNAYEDGRNEKGCPVIFSSGNLGEELDTLTYPKNLDNTFTVGAANKYGNITVYSSHGPELDIAAFGGFKNDHDIRTTDREGDKGYNDGNYTETFSGTSAACPQVSGVAALLLSVYPDLTVEEVYCRLKSTATDLGGFGHDNYYGAGIVNAYRAIVYENMDLIDKNFGGLQDFWATNTITSTGTVIEDGADVTLRAGNRIHVTSGHAKAGSNFHAYINSDDPCAESGAKMLVVSNSTENNQQASMMDDMKSESFKKAIFAAYPNPFTTSTTITFGLQQPSKVNIYITNSYGQKVHQVYHNFTEAGNYDIKLEGSGLQPGLYFCIMETETSHEVIKIVKM